MKSLYALALSLALPSAAQAASFDVTLNASWLASDYDVSSTGPSGATNSEVDDDAVFGIAPSDGSLSITLRVNDASETFFDAATSGSNHDFYGYSDVSIVGGTFTYGSASWSDGDILTGLVGPDGSTAALWMDTSVASLAPSLASFRMISDWFDASADIFFGTRIGSTPSDAIGILNNFSMQEYFAGERLGSNPGYSISVVPAAPVPLPAGALLLLSGAAGFGLMRRAQKRH